ncbi:HlyD family secretion protein [Consotaella salsifontis]|uniref:Membrane fusion protein, multidrug efflux system n=1 Tax=Consotaella salsifontis TaxID=1365950 RepID=A0A1T4RZU5_9HYPH|nr:HlyD family secretion protein [Consotaella salsifontis]SKA21513.1 membrane fusion protein, multidrug efflux system [Consotaella salsifontis]
MDDAQAAAAAKHSPDSASDDTPAAARQDGSGSGGSAPSAGHGGEDQGNGAEDKQAKRSFLRRHPFWVALAVLVIAAAAVGGYFYWLIDIEPYESTDDAFVDSRQFAVSPKVSGYVTEVAVTDNQHVNAGDLLFRIDQRDYQIALQQAEAQEDAAKAAIASADAQIEAQEAQVEAARSQVAQAQASLNFAEEQAKRAQELVKSGAGTVETAQQQASNLQQAQADLVHAKAAVTAAEKQVRAQAAQKGTAIADEKKAAAQLAAANLDLEHTTIEAAQPGRVVRLSGAKGAFAQAGQSLAMFVPDEVWITANFKETQITDMRPGQPADISIDAYPDQEVKGHVASIQPGSGTAFSLLPAENATGNYVKVVQRIPVKITVDKWPEDVAIGPGMSVVPTVTVRPRS